MVVLGAGFGGLAAAHALRRGAGDDIDLVLVDESPTFLMGLRKLWLLDGRSSPGEGTRDRTALSRASIPFRQGRVEAIDRDARHVRVDGADIDYDFLVVALGAQQRIDLVPGEPDGNPNLYTVDGATEAGERLQGLEEGRVVIAIAGVPIKCPPAPYEAAFLVDGLLRRKGRREQVELEVLTPQPMSVPAAGPAACSAIEGRLASRGIRFRPKTSLAEAGPGTLTLEDGGTIRADLLLLAPPHRPPAVVGESGLAGESGWVKVDPATLQTEDERVFAVGDVVEMATGMGLPFPKAGVFAESHGEVVGRNIVATIAGGEPDAAFDGFGFCFLEVGGGRASMVRGNFLASPPDVTIEEDAPEHLASKEQFERERLERWFPG
ncbi:MAG TPA: FAD/NAD(P)-binding oxidoreductase [Actinomycetota bacterium]|nr:FAD/NAD(P)-binding oxidoreductase [Actinomycetota bacterium]